MANEREQPSLSSCELKPNSMSAFSLLFDFQALEYYNFLKTYT